VVIIILLNLLPVAAQSAVVEQDSLALVALYVGYKGDNWTHHDNWLSKKIPVSQWQGVILDSDGKRVIGLNLNNNNIKGLIPTDLMDLLNFISILNLNIFDIGKLTIIITKLYTFHADQAPLGELRILNIADNKFSGNIPESIGKISKLEIIDFSKNQFDGSIQKAFANLINLKQLNLSKNLLKGSIPTKLCGLSKLALLDLDSNQLNGNIPPEIKNLSNITRLILDNNQFSGSIPPEIGDLTTLIQLSLSQNKLTGNIPHEIGKLFNLDSLNLAGDSLSGSIPSEIGQLESLEYLALNNNQLTGSIPGEMGNMKSLSECVLNSNQLSGKVPRELANLSKLNYLRIDDNYLEGTIPTDFMNLTKLESFDFANNSITEIPTLSQINVLLLCQNNYLTFEDFELNVDAFHKTNLKFEYSPQKHFGRAYDTLTTEGYPFSLSIPCGGHYNHYKWFKNDEPLPSNDDSTFQFSKISVSDTGYYHVIVTNDLFQNLILTSQPVHLSVKEHCLKNDSLALVALYNSDDGVHWATNTNWLEGPVRSWHGVTADECSVLQINLNDNRLKGTLPSEIGQLSKLTVLNLGHNQLYGTIPEEIGQLFELTQLLMGTNQLEGTIPPGIGNLINLISLDLSANQLSGNIPHDIDNLIHLQDLFLNDNLFTGLPTLSNIDSLLTCYSNYLTFEDFECNLPLIRNREVDFEYSPQYPFGREYDTTAMEKEPFSLSIPCGGVYNHYKWYKNGEIVTSAFDASTLTFSNIQLSDEGIYSVTVTNDSVPDLELRSLPVTLIVNKLPPEPLKPVNMVIIEGSRNPNFMIENLKEYPDCKLMVFTKWGKLVYKKTGYNNDLDFSTYAEGTYYYILTYQTKEGEKQLKNFVDVLKR
jgi:Leucine-rich repeat (LRR) protein